MVGLDVLYTSTQVVLNYHIASNYGWSHLVAGANSIITKINAGCRINARSLVGPQ